jgi:RNA polymerase sigma-70 factor, ECF subfamily
MCENRYIPPHTS